MALHNTLGVKGEQLAVDYLIQQGYQIIAANWQQHKFEIDVIAQDGGELVIVEVKTRATNFFGAPEEAVTPSKIKHLVEGANHYIETNEIDLECRFDVIAIVLNGISQEINHIKNAFYPEVE
ncbi:MAG: YraN family protein [Vicingus serpentipes]|nr:YraN family protein [Vicingus serpentipes]